LREREAFAGRTDICSGARLNPWIATTAWPPGIELSIVSTIRSRRIAG